MSKIFKYKTKNGLNVVFIKRKGFNKKYAGIGVKFGGYNKIYLDSKGNKHVLKNGVAHFLEHKLFDMPSGINMLNEFENINAYVNAYTAGDKTIYHTSTNTDIIKPLKLLIDMVFTPYFTYESVEKEKPIILSEFSTTTQTIKNKIIHNYMQTLYPSDQVAEYIIGEMKDIQSITKDDLYEAYNNFYTKDNLILTICGDLDENYLFNEIENIISNYKINGSNVKSIDKLKSKKPHEPIEEGFDLLQDELYFLIRLDDVYNTDPISCEKLLGILDVALSMQMPFYTELLKKDLIPNGLDFYVNTAKNSSYIVINGPTKNPKLLAKKLKKYLFNLKEEDLNKELIDLYFKTLKSELILKEDDIEYLGDDVLSLALEDIDYNDQVNKILSLKENDVIDMLKYIKNAKYSYYVVIGEKK